MLTLEKIKQDRILAMKNKDSKLSSFLGILMSDIIKIGKDKRNSESTEDEAIQVLKKYAKIINDNLNLKGLSSTQIEEFKKELEILNLYLPKQISEGELKIFINKQQGKTRGEIFKLLKETYGNSFDSKLARELIKS